MTPRALMIAGAMMALFGAIIAILRGDTVQIAPFLLAAGAVFGKGYGIHEERTRGGVRRRSADTASAEADTRGLHVAFATPRSDAAAPPDLIAAARQMVCDYQTSEHHHPNHVLVPLAAFRAMQVALPPINTEASV